MKIELKEITIRDVVDGYKNNQEEGVIGYGEKLNIRPKYQREFVYNDKQQESVINTLQKNFPLNVMYWVKNENDNYEVLDGQQRTMSICEYVAGTFSINFQYYHNLTEDEQNKILDYKLMVYFCEGTDKEKLDWFKTINIAGAELTNQELRNAVYTGTWLSDAKRYFSKKNCSAYNLGNEYVKGKVIRQEYLETALKWISNDNIEKYMSEHQNDEDASELWDYYKKVISWVQGTFTEYRKEMLGLDWGFLYNEHKLKEFNSVKVKDLVSKLMQDEEIENKKGIYHYVLNGKEKHLNIRLFSENQKRESWEKQGGVCPKCNFIFLINEMEADHITPWSKGGKTSAENCQMLCVSCNRTKSDK